MGWGFQIKGKKINNSFQNDLYKGRKNGFQRFLFQKVSETHAYMESSAKLMMNAGYKTKDTFKQCFKSKSITFKFVFHGLFKVFCLFTGG